MLLIYIAQFHKKTYTLIFNYHASITKLMEKRQTNRFNTYE